MILISRLRSILHWLLRRNAAERNLDADIESIIELSTAAKLRDGVPSDEARRLAILEIGGVEQTKERVRTYRSGAFLDDIGRDIRYAFRSIGKSFAFFLTVMVTLALGIGANTAIFSAIDAVLLRTLPVKEPHQLVILDCLSKNGGRGSFSHADFQWIRDRNDAFSGVAASSEWQLEFKNRGVTQKLKVGLISGDFFPTLGVETGLGRLIDRTDENLTNGFVAVISDAFWRREFGADASIVGRQMTLADRTFEIVGVAPPEFFGVVVGDNPDVWVPLSVQPQVGIGNRSFLQTRNVGWLELFARLRPGVSPEQARDRLAVLYSSMQPELKINPNNDSLNHIGVRDGSGGFSGLRNQFSFPLQLLMGVVGLVLLIVCANVANLMLARSATRQREFAVRLALGASRGTLIRQLLVESMLVALFSAFGALWTAYVLDQTLLQMADIRTIQLSLDWRALSFTAILATLTSVICSLAPAIKGFDIDPSRGVKLDSRFLGDRVRRSALGRSLVIGQIAFGLMLLMTATVFIRSLHNLENADVGFDQDDVLQVRIDSSASSYKGARNLFSALSGRIGGLDGVRSVSASTYGFGFGLSRSCCISLDGQSIEQGVEKVVRVQQVSPGYFETIGIPLMAGRDFTAAETAESPDVAVINETLARKYFGRTDIIGRRFGFAASESNRIEIIGVVRDSRYDAVREDTAPMIFQSVFQHPNNVNFIQVSITPGLQAADVQAAVSDNIKAVDKQVSIVDVATLKVVVGRTLSQERLVAKLSGAFGALALGLICLGVYGVVAYAVSRRTSEIGLRIALGARPGNVQRMILRETLWITLMGVGVGALAAMASGHWITHELFGVRPSDPISFALSIAMITATALTASLIPALRASHIDPMDCLRLE